MANISSAQSGNWSNASTWVGGIAPGDGDTAVIASGHSVAVDTDVTVGDNVSAVGDAISISGTLTVDDGITLTVKGIDTSANRAVYIAPGGVFSPADGSIIEIDLASDGQTVIKNEGDIILGNCAVQAKEYWAWSSQGKTLSSYVKASRGMDGTRVIGMCPLGTTVAATSESCSPYGAVSNAAGTGIGSFGDHSLVFTSVTQPSLAFTTEVATFDALQSTGDYYVDCNNGVLYYYDSQFEPRLTVTYTVTMGRRYGASIWSDRNGASRFIALGTTFKRLGSNYGSHYSEYLQQGILLRYRTHIDIDPTKEGRVSGCTFEHCIVPLQVYNTTNSSLAKLDCTGNAYLYTPRTTGNFLGNVLIGYAQYVDFSGSQFDSVQRLSGGLRTPMVGITISNCTGSVFVNSIFPVGNGPIISGSVADGNVLTDTGTWSDGGGFQSPGISGAPNIYTNNILRLGNRCGRINSYMTVEDNKFINYTHHGFVAPAAAGFFSGISIKRNQIVDAPTSGDMAGGWTLGYNYTQWLDDVEISNNTFDTGTRSIMFNDGEGTVVLGTRLRIFNNILSNNGYGIYQPAADASNQTKKQLQRLDYNDEYGHTVTSNVLQSTFIKDGIEYNLDTSRSCLGITLQNPSTLPLSAKTLQLAVSGTPGTDFSMLLSYGGGTAVELVCAQGTATGGTSASSHTAPGTLVDSSQAWTTNNMRCDQGKIVSGTGSNQIFMVRANTADTLTLMPNTASGALTAPSTDSVYIVVRSEITLSDGTNTVDAGVYLSDLPLAAGTYADTGITAITNALSIDPQYVGVNDYTPNNMSLSGTGYDGADIGALAYVTSGGTQSDSITVSGTGSLTSTGYKIGIGASAVAGTALVALTGLKKVSGSVNISALADFIATGFASVSGSGSGVFTGTGAVTSTGYKIASGNAEISAIQAATFTGVKKAISQAIIDAIAVYATTGEQVLNLPSGDGVFTALSNVSTTGYKIAVADSAYSASDDVIEVGFKTAYGDALISGTATLTISGWNPENSIKLLTISVSELLPNIHFKQLKPQIIFTKLGD